MKKLLVVLCLSVVWAAKAEASGSNRGAKGMTAVNYTTTVTSVTIGPGVVYEVIVSTQNGAGDFFVFWDSATSVGLTSAVTTNMRGRIILSSTTATFPIYQFDPPLQFNNGIMVGNSSAANTATVVWEKGRVTQGY